MKLDEYLIKYERLLQGMIPDSSIDTNRFIQQLESEKIDIQLMLDTCSKLDIPIVLQQIMNSVQKECKNSNCIMIRFRKNLVSWIKTRIEKDVE